MVANQHQCIFASDQLFAVSFEPDLMLLPDSVIKLVPGLKFRLKVEMQISNSV